MLRWRWRHERDSVKPSDAESECWVFIQSRLSGPQGEAGHAETIDIGGFDTGPADKRALSARPITTEHCRWSSARKESWKGAVPRTLVYGMRRKFLTAVACLVCQAVRSPSAPFILPRVHSNTDKTVMRAATTASATDFR